ncbi:hypothetical protein GCM10010345_92320 [Streptomyces canarius]|uniref:Uncharacterized protein n=1 Tax=Streptomyces canarius TaxID=285453 RepID=A0ABQ3DDQ6_9ACTN|nr:hypothetical protein GCM10010345_92320 [Streptomyces canarius]
MFTDCSQSGKEVPAVRVQELKAGDVDRPRSVVDVQRRVQSAAEGVDGEDVEAAVADEGRGVGHGVKDAQDAVRKRATGAFGTAGGASGDGAGQVVEVGAFGLVQMQGARDRVEDFFGGSGEVAALQADVVVDADAGEHRDFLAAQPGHAPVAAVGGQPRLLRGDLGAARGQEVADVALGTHALQARREPRMRGVLSVPGTAVPSTRAWPALSSVVAAVAAPGGAPEARLRTAGAGCARFHDVRE